MNLQKSNRNNTYNPFKKYDDLDRFISYYNQIMLVKKVNPKDILEIGVGTQALSTYLKLLKFNVTTRDSDKNLKPA